MNAEKKTGKDRTQREVRNEQWSDERIKSYLDTLPPQGTPADYNILLVAYRGMLPETFAKFITFFVEAGHDINTSIEDGSNMLDLISSHRNSAEYAETLADAGAVRSSN